mgnify:CR=1 FL=1|tara:strand:+ start:740 stop:1345 length:606 start_codon:yes stop_codon:yes gene_type:complete
MSINVCNNNSLSAITSIPASISGGALNLISTQTASSSSTISFTSGIDSTYKEYIFKFTDIHPASDSVQFTFNGSADSGSNYNVTKTSSVIETYHNESGSSSGNQYNTTFDIAQGTGFQSISGNIGNENDRTCAGQILLFEPSSTTFVKHYIANVQFYHSADFSINHLTAGYFNTTSAIDAIQFKMSSGNIDAGTIKLYGVS